MNSKTRNKSADRQRLKYAHNQAKLYLINYLDSLNLSESSRDILEAEFAPLRNRQPFNNLSEIYRNMVGSLINRSGFSNYIGLNTLDRISNTLGGYDCHYVAHHLTVDKLINEFEKIASNGSKIKTINRKNKRNAWVQFANGIISCAKYLSQFEDAKGFNNYVKKFLKSDYSIVVLPLIMGEEIQGYGFALSCDFLKESGFTGFCKPDVHLMKIFHGVGLVNDDNSQVATFIKTIEMARAVNEDPVIVDKLFWIIGSGKFHEYNKAHKKIIKVTRHRDDFIKEYNKEVKEII